MAPHLRLSFLSLALLSHFSEASPRVLGLDFEKREISLEDPVNRLSRRASTVTATLYNAQSNLLYLVNATVGTPPQKFSLQLDTGSSDIWIPWASSSACSPQQRRCTNGKFDDTKSSTFVDVAPDEFQITYVDQTKIAGDYINDTFGMGNAQIKGMTMGLAKQSAEQDTASEFQGIVGVGFDTGEAIYAQTNGRTTYPNIISQLVNQGVISTKAYSLWLNDLESNTGSILFGGIDYAKFHGDLTILPLQTDVTGGISSFTVALNSLQFVGNPAKPPPLTYNQTIPVILDSGTTLTYLPDAVANAIAEGVGAVSNPSYGVVVRCNVSHSAAVVRFQFGNSNGPTIVAAVSQFVLPFPSNIPTPKFRDGNTACRWGILPSEGNPNLFGDTFLRSAYVVYNIAGNQVGIASTNFNSTSQDIREITAPSSIPGASATAAGAAQQTHTGPVYLTAGIGGAAATSAIFSATGTGTWDLGVGTKTAAAAASSSKASGSSSSTKKGAGAMVLPPSKPFTAAIAGGMVALLAILGGSIVIFV